MADDPTFDPTVDPDELDPGLAEIEAMLRDLSADDLELTAPPAAVWAGIEAELAAEAAPAGPTSVAATPDEPDSPTAPVVPLHRRRWVIPTLVAAAVIVVAVGVVAVIGTRGSEPTTLATADLEFDPATFDPVGSDAAATAVLVDEDGNEVLEIDDESLPFDLDEDAALELWMIRVDDGEIVDMVSLGDIEADGTRSFEVPAGYDPAVFSVVDISVEPHDGVSTHSGRSILRGQLDPA